MLTMYQQITIKTLHKQGVNKSQIAREMGCHRNTVSNVVGREVLLDKQSRNKASFFDDYKQQISQWLEKKASRVRIHELLDEEYGVSRSYDSLCKYIQKHFPKKIEAYGVQITKPGEECEIDFGYVGMQPNNQGGKSKTWILVVTLSYSRYSFYKLCNDQKIGTLIEGMKQAFEYFAGVPKRMKVDNMRTAIAKNQHYDLQLNQDFLEFANHHQTVIIPCTPYHPHQKGKVESDVGYVKGNFFCAREFVDRSDMESQLYDWMTNYANVRVHGTSKKVPAEVFHTDEKTQLQTLPENPFSFFNRGVRVVSKNCHIKYRDNYYSVPSYLVGKTISIRYNHNILRAIYKLEQVAIHQINHQAGEYITQRSHLPEHKYYSQTEYQKKYELKMANIGQHAQEYFSFLLTDQKSYWFRTTRAILGLAKQQGNGVVNLSLKRALVYKVTSISTIKNIVDKKLYLLDQEPFLPKQPQLSDEAELQSLDEIQTALSLVDPGAEGSDGSGGKEVGDENDLDRDLEYYQQALM